MSCTPARQRGAQDHCGLRRVRACGALVGALSGNTHGGVVLASMLKSYLVHEFFVPKMMNS